MTARSLRLGWLLLALGSVAGLLVAGRDWWQITADASAGAALSGSTVTAGLATALPVVTLVGLVLSWTLRTTGKRIVAVVLGLAGLGMTILGVTHPRPSDTALLDALRAVSLADRWQATATAWVWVYAGCGVVVLGGAVLVSLAAAGSRSAERFRREPDPDQPAPPAADPALDDDDAALWKSLDRGIDPTDPTASRSGGNAPRFHRSDPAQPE